MTNRRRRALRELGFILLLAPAVGVLAGLGGVVLVWLIRTFHFFFFESLGLGGPASGRWALLAAPLAGGLLAGPLMTALSPESRGGGIMAVLRALAVRGGRLRPMVIPVKLVASALCIGSGASGGREGPTVQVGAAIASVLGQLVRLSEERLRILVACGAAGGIAATFDAPLGGVFFALEVILGQYGPRYFSAVVMASVTSAVVSRFYLGRFPAFEVPPYELLAPGEMPLYLLLGLLCGLGSWFYIRSLDAAECFFQRLSWHPSLKPALGGLGVGLIALWAPEVMGDGFATINLALAGGLALWMALGLALLNTVATALTIGSGNSGGLYGPSLFLGATLGCAFGKACFEVLGVATPPGSFALVGMGAVSAAVAQAPVSSILMLFEMSGNYQVLLPVMAASIVSTLLVRNAVGGSIFTDGLTRKGIDVWRFRGGDLLSRIAVAEATLPTHPVAGAGQQVQEALEIARNTHFAALPVLDDEGRLVGLVDEVTLNEAAEQGRSEEPVTNLMATDFLVTWPDETLREAVLKLDEVPHGALPVLDRVDPHAMLGVLTERGVLLAYHRRVEEIDTVEGGVQDLAGWDHADLFGAEEYGIPLRCFPGEMPRYRRDSFSEVARLGAEPPATLEP